jgi:hypothetical protein
MKRLLLLFCLAPFHGYTQFTWKNVDDRYQPLPTSVHVFFTNDSIDGKPNVAYYVESNLKDKHLVFSTDTTDGRRLTPTQFFEKNSQPLLVVNSTFFEFVHQRNLNLVINGGKLLAYNKPGLPGKGKDTFTYRHTFPSAIGINRKRKADVAWTYTDSSSHKTYAIQVPAQALRDSSEAFTLRKARKYTSTTSTHGRLKNWKMRTAIGGGPVLVQDGKVKVTNNEEIKFAGKAIDDKHPRTAMGYTADGRLIIMVVQGRFPGKAEGATLTQLATMLQQLGCVEAINLDGGGSSCLLINGKQTIQPSDKEGQRAVPAVFMIK